MQIVEYVRARSIVPTHQLLSEGWNGRQLARAVHRGELIRVRQGWYAAPDLPAEFQQAFRVGGALTCSGAGRMLGLSVRDSPHVHVAVGAHSSRLRDPLDSRRRLPRTSATVHWVAAAGAAALIRQPLDVLADMALCQRAELTIAAVDSALRLGLIRRTEWVGICARLPHALGGMLSEVSAASESITESLTRVRLRGLGIPVRVQFRVRGVGRVDLLVGDRLVIELDGYSFHSGRQGFENDRRRDALLSILGYRVLRFSYRQVMSNWGQVKGAILAAIARGDHQS